MSIECFVVNVIERENKRHKEVIEFFLKRKAAFSLNLLVKNSKENIPFSNEDKMMEIETCLLYTSPSPRDS